MPDSDTVAKFRRNKATQIEWSIRTNLPVQRLLDETRNTNGRTTLRNVPVAHRTSTLSKPRVLRESASDLTELENAAHATYLKILERLKGRHGRTTVERMFPSQRLPDNWSSVRKSDAQPALTAFHDACASLSLPARVKESAGNIVAFLTSVTGRQFNDLGHLQDVDLADWRTDHGVLRNVLGSLGNPADWVQTWLEAGTPCNISSRDPYTYSYTVLALNAVVAARRFCSNLWASRRQWERRGYRVVDGERGAPVFHYFAPPDTADDQDTDEGGGRTGQGPLRRVSFVFNASQVRRPDGRPFRMKNLVQKRRDVDACISRHGARVVHRADEGASYDREADLITMPPRISFQRKAGRAQATVDYYATLLHELVHWTGHESRLARPFGYDCDSDEYRFEELIAELGSGFLCARFGLSNARRLTAGKYGVAAYINGWLKRGRDPVDLVLDAAGEANRASNYLIYRENRKL